MGKIFVVAGLHFGDEGKGTVVDCLTRKLGSASIVRYCGGPQAAHNVITENGLHHTFAQLGSGMFVDGTKTFLSEFMLIEPSSLMYEEEIFNKKVNREINNNIFIDEDCYIVTPYDKGFCRIWASVSNRSTCGMGVGEAARSREYGTSIQVKDIINKKVLKEKLKLIRYSKMERAADIIYTDKNRANIFQEMLNIDLDKIISMYEKFYHRYNVVKVVDMIKQEIKINNLIFEGSQGILLDRRFGCSPFVTSCDVGLKNALKLLYEIPISDIDESKVVGVIRPYAHRHGDGPLPTQIAKPFCKKDEHNLDNKWQKEFRYGWFDCLLTGYALSKVIADEIIITNFDRMPDQFKICKSYLYNKEKLESLDEFKTNHCIWHIVENSTPEFKDINKIDFIHFFENKFNTKVVAISNGPTANDKLWRNDV